MQNISQRASLINISDFDLIIYINYVNNLELFIDKDHGKMKVSCNILKKLNDGSVIFRLTGDLEVVYDAYCLYVFSREYFCHSQNSKYIYS